MNAKQAYQDWQNTHKINLRVYTDEEMFALGFNAAQKLLEDMTSLLEETHAKLKKAENAVKTARAKKNPE